MKLMIALMILFWSLVSSAQSDGVASTALSELKKPGHFAVMRHTRAPGVGDPAGFKLEDCKTQRNLSADGVAQAKRLGQQLKAAIGSNFYVFTSQWCRCIDTAKNLAGRSPENLSALNSFFQDPSTNEKQTAEFRKWLTSNIKKKHPLVLVTHQVNITALTGVFPAEGEVIVLKVETNGSFSVVGSYESVDM